MYELRYLFEAILLSSWSDFVRVWRWGGSGLFVEVGLFVCLDFVCFG